MKTGRLKFSEWESLIPETPGRVRENHSSPDCDGGRESMIIERKEDGSANAHCFRCNRSGYFRPARHFGSHRKVVEAKPTGHASTFGKTLPTDATQEWGAIPGVVKVWLLSGGVSSKEVVNSGFWWSESQQKLWIEVRQTKSAFGHTVVGYVVRGFDPKFYRTATSNPTNFFGYYPGVSSTTVINNTVMIVEDVVSAIKCSQVVDSIALMGTELKPAIVSQLLASGYERAYVWLDMDNPTVRLKARKIAKGLPFLSVSVVDTGKDPKHHSVEEIKGVLK